MHPSSPHMMAVANSFWPFPYQLKSYDMALHPAFLQTAYRGLPALPYSPQCEPAPTTTSSPSPPQKPADKFSIDAILNKDTEKHDTSRELHVNVDPVHEQTKSYTDFMKYAKDDDVIKRRHQRLLEVTHPYLSQTGSLHDKDFLQKHIQTTYKQFTESVRSQEKDKKTSQCSDSWSSKSGKGKRVRTIFTPEQLERMEAEFERQQYMVGTERYYLASSLNLTEAQVKVWFQNRRIKWRKQHLEQQQAKLKSLNIYRQADSNSDSDSEDDVTSGTRNVIMERDHGSIIDPFQSPKESRTTQ